MIRLDGHINRKSVVPSENREQPHYHTADCKADVCLYCLAWHISGGSAVNLIVEPLAEYFDFKILPWNGSTFDAQLPSHKSLVWFHQFLPPIELWNDKRLPVIWSPMWDNVRDKSQQWWNRLPKHIRVVAFSDGAAAHAERAGLRTLRLHYFLDPATVRPAIWSGERVLLYWNRTGLFRPTFLEHLCAALRIDRLIFRSQVDPGWSAGIEYTLPQRLGNTVVEIIPGYLPREQYFALLERANIFLAPRLEEGVGISVLEAMARGMAVIAHDAPAMNEYIRHGHNGILLPRGWDARRVLNGFRGRLATHGIGNAPPYEPMVSSRQEWEHLAAYDLQKLGQTARQDHGIGFSRWQQQIEDYARFIIGA